jgi:carboxypeptidase T
MTQLLLRETRGVLILVASLLWLQFLDIAQADDHDPYAKIRVRVSDISEIVRLHQLGVEVERAGKPGKDGITCIARGKILERLRSEGISFEVMVPDLERFYADRLTPGPVNALGFGYGSLGGYYTLDEIRQQLDSLRHMYPAVVGMRDSIGASLQGRPIWAVRMTANPDVTSQRPQVLYFAMQHAREPEGMMTLLYFMWHLAEHYGQDPEATYLLENRDLWFIPIVNVDGYEANRRINPNGGGMRRKNMRNVSYDGDGYGVDLNRNWGAEWGYDDLGSSPYPLYIDYRGTGPFSEPETQVVRDFFKGKSFRFAM